MIINLQNVNDYTDRSIFDWDEFKAYKEINYHYGEGNARIAFHKPEIHIAFTTHANDELIESFMQASYNADVDSQLGIQHYRDHTTQLFYMTNKGQDRRNAYDGKRETDFKEPPLEIIEERSK